MAYWDSIFESTIHTVHIRRRQIYRDSIMEDMANWENMILHSWHIKRTQLHIHRYNILRIRPIEERKKNKYIYMNGILGGDIGLLRNWRRKDCFPLFIKNSGSLVWKSFADVLLNIDGTGSHRRVIYIMESGYTEFTNKVGQLKEKSQTVGKLKSKYKISWHHSQWPKSVKLSTNKLNLSQKPWAFITHSKEMAWFPSIWRCSWEKGGGI